MELKNKIRSINDYPKEGIIFRDITTLLRDKDAYKEAMDQLAIKAREFNPDIIMGVEARGFIIGSVLAYILGCGFVPVRKPGKLPFEKIEECYGLEYGSDCLELHTDALEKGEKVLIIDDLLATGGTSKASANLVERLGGEVTGFLFLVELVGLGGRDRLKGYKVESVLKFEEN